MTNPQIKPTFLEDTVIVLTKDYTKLDPLCNRHFKKGVVGYVIACGHSIYAYSDKIDSLSVSVLVEGD